MERVETVAALSRLIGKAYRYLSDWVRNGRPDWLELADCRKLERFLGIDEAEIGWPEEIPSRSEDSPFRRN